MTSRATDVALELLSLAVVVPVLDAVAGACIAPANVARVGNGVIPVPMSRRSRSRKPTSGGSSPGVMRRASILKSARSPAVSSHES